MPSCTYDYRKTSSDDRPKYTDGRLIPQPGDEVYQMVPGFGGFPSSLQGIVLGKQVRITGGSTLIGAIPIGKRYKLTPAWTVINDPAVKAKQEARERAEAEEKIKKEQDKHTGVETVEKEAHKRGLKQIKSTKGINPGDTVYLLYPNYSDPSKIEVIKEIVHEISPRGFTYLNEHGTESTSGDIENWWI